MIIQRFFPILAAALFISSLCYADQVEDLIRVVGEASDSEQKLAAIQLLGSIGDDRAVPTLSGLVNSEDLQLGYASIKSLGLIGSEAARDVLSKLVAEGNSDISHGALVGLAMARDPETFSLAEKALASENWGDRWYAVLALEILGDVKSVPLFEKALTDSYQLPEEGRYPVREAAQAALDKLKSSIQWSYALSDGLAQSRLTQKPLFLYFYINGGEWCEQLEVESFSSPEVLDLIREFVAVRVNAYADQSIAQQFSISGTPTIVALNKEGSEISRVQGYLTRSELVTYLSEVLSASKEESGNLSNWLQAKSLVERGDFQGALPLLESLLQNQETSEPDRKTEAEFMLALSYGKTDQFERSKLAFERFIKEHPESAWMDKAMYCLALAKLHLKEYTSAQENLTDLIARFPESSVVSQAQSLLNQISEIT